MERWTRFHPAVFFVTFISYGLFHTGRRTLSLVKTKVIDVWTPPPDHTVQGPVSFIDNTWTRSSLFRDQESAENFLGVLDAIFLFVYSLGLYLSGMMADRVDLRRFLAAGMALTAAVLFLCGPVLEWCGGYSQGAYVVLMVLNAVLQSTGWPCVLSAMGNWFGVANRGLVLGIWSASPSVGSIVGALLVSSVVDYGYEYAFLLTSAVLFSWSVVVFFGLVPTPQEVGLSILDEEALSYDSSDRQHHTQTKQSVAKSLQNLSQILFHAKQTKQGNTDCIRSETEYIRLKSSPHLCYGTNVNQPDNEGGAKSCINHQHINLVDKRILPACTQIPSDDVILENQPCLIHEILTGTPGDDLVFDSLENSTCENARDNEKETVHLHPDNNDSMKPVIEVIPIGWRMDSKQPSEVPPAQSKEETASDTDDEAGSTPASPPSRLQAVKFFTVILLPGVIPYSMAYACVKMVNYIFYFWLPLYLSSAHDWPTTTANQLSILYDVGGVLGTTLAGMLSNKLNKNGLVVSSMLVIGLPVLYMYGHLPIVAHLSVNGVMLIIMGASIGGAANLISTVISTDLGRQKAVQGSSQALSIVSGIIEGTGTLGAALGQLAVPQLNTVFGWTSVFYLMMAAVFLTVVNICHITVAEIKDICAHRQQDSGD